MRDKLEAEIICYKVIPLDQDIISLETPFHKAPGENLICHLQITVRENVLRKGATVHDYDWKLAFPLPLFT